MAPEAGPALPPSEDGRGSPTTTTLEQLAILPIDRSAGREYRASVFNNSTTDLTQGAPAMTNYCNNDNDYVGPDWAETWDAAAEMEPMTTPIGRRSTIAEREAERARNIASIGSGTPAPPVKNSIELVLRPIGWVAYFSGPHATEVQALFGSSSIPTAFGPNVSTDAVVASITALNPGTIVTVKEN